MRPDLADRRGGPGRRFQPRDRPPARGGEPQRPVAPSRVVGRLGQRVPHARVRGPRRHVQPPGGEHRPRVEELVQEQRLEQPEPRLALAPPEAHQREPAPAQRPPAGADQPEFRPKEKVRLPDDVRRPRREQRLNLNKSAISIPIFYETEQNYCYCKYSSKTVRIEFV